MEMLSQRIIEISRIVPTLVKHAIPIAESHDDPSEKIVLYIPTQDGRPTNDSIRAQVVLEVGKALAGTGPGM